MMEPEPSPLEQSQSSPKSLDNILLSHRLG